MATPRLRRTALSATAIALTLAGLTASTGADSAQGGAPQSVDFVALSADGAPIPDLTAGQVKLKIGGRDREVTALEFVRFDAHTNVLPPPFATNSAADAGRDFVIVVDEESLAIGTEGPVREALLAFGVALPARDRIGLFTVPRGTTAIAPTTDRAAFRIGVGAVKGRLATGARTGTTSGETSTAGCHGRDVLTALTSIVRDTSRPAGPTPTVLVSAAIAAPDMSVASLGAGLTGQSVIQSQECKLTTREFQALGQAVAAARSQVFVVRPVDTVGQTEGLEAVVGVTGGQMLTLGRTSDDAMLRIAKQTSGYYVATFTADAGERNGASHRVEVQSTRADVTMRSRPGVVIPKADRAVTPQAMLRTAAVQTGFGLRALAVASRNDGDAKNSVKLYGLAEATDPAVKIAAAAAGVYDANSKLVAQWTAKPEELQRSPFAAALVIPAGVYRVRVAAVDAQGRAATADYDLNTEMVSAGVATLGSLLIGTANPGFMPKLLFSTEPEVMVYFELYGRPTGGFDAVVEIAESADGPALAASPPTPAATPVQDKFQFTAKLPITSLKPGDYVVRAKITFPGQPTGTLLRTIRKK